MTDDGTGELVRLRRLQHGRILHGAQFLDPVRRALATTYYGPSSGVDVAIREHSHRKAGRPLRIGVVGLGAGTVAAWGQRGDHVRFFEINPIAELFARKYFYYLADSHAGVDVVIGDARLSIERELRDGTGVRAYDVLVIDAFSGDAIPVHLLTREAFARYKEALAPDGVLAVHVSNQYLDLRPVVRGLGQELGERVLEIESHDDLELGLDSVHVDAGQRQRRVPGRGRPLRAARARRRAGRRVDRRVQQPARGDEAPREGVSCRHASCAARALDRCCAAWRPS